jgi:hypothetical protein
MFDRHVHHQRVVAEEAERERRRLLILQIVDAGVRSMATKAHPDAGGSNEDFQRLMECKRILRRPYIKKPKLRRDLRNAVNRVLAT